MPRPILTPDRWEDKKRNWIFHIPSDNFFLDLFFILFIYFIYLFILLFFCYYPFFYSGKNKINLRLA